METLNCLFIFLFVDHISSAWSSMPHLQWLNAQQVGYTHSVITAVLNTGIKLQVKYECFSHLLMCL